MHPRLGALAKMEHMSAALFVMESSGSFCHACSLSGREQGALKLGGPEQTERGSRLGGPEQKLGSRARAGSAERLGDSKMRHCLFIAPVCMPSCKHQALSKLCRCRSRMAAFSSIRSARSTGALMIHGNNRECHKLLQFRYQTLCFSSSLSSSARSRRNVEMSCRPALPDSDSLEGLTL